MSIEALITVVLGVSIFLAVLTEGMVVSGADIRYLFSQAARLVRTILAMNVLGPIVAVTVCLLFSLHPAVIVALVTLSIAPVGSLFPQGMVALVAAGRGAYAQHGLARPRRNGQRHFDYHASWSRRRSLSRRTR